MHKRLEMLWIFLVLAVLAFLTYLLLLPIDIVISSVDNEYFVNFGKLARADIEKDEDYIVRISLKTFFTKFNFYPLQRKKAKKAKSKPRKKRTFKWSHMNKAVSLIRSFEVRHFFLNIDTGNCITNAKIYPVFAFLNFWGGNFQVNFIGENQVDLHLQNRPYKIIKSFINPKKVYHGITL